MAIDRLAREVVAKAIEDYLRGSIDNFELDDRLAAIDTTDELCERIISQMWFMYDGVSRHRNQGKWHISKSSEAALRRWTTLLISSQEWIWKDRVSLYHGKNPVEWLRNRIIRMYYNRVPMLDDNEFWPFCGAAEWTTWMEMNMVPKE